MTKIFACGRDVMATVVGEREIENGVDTQLKAILTLIETLDFDDAHSNDHEYGQKALVHILYVIGKLMKDRKIISFDNADYIGEVSKFILQAQEKHLCSSDENKLLFKWSPEMSVSYN